MHIRLTCNMKKASLNSNTGSLSISFILPFGYNQLLLGGFPGLCARHPPFEGSRFFDSEDLSELQGGFPCIYSRHPLFEGSNFFHSKDLFEPARTSTLCDWSPAPPPLRSDYKTRFSQLNPWVTPCGTCLPGQPYLNKQGRHIDRTLRIFASYGRDLHSSRTACNR